MFDAVTPCVGVWIETMVRCPELTTEAVTPCVGVWIETTLCFVFDGWGKVTPCVGVWIETWGIFYFLEIRWSHPAWVCGLKRSSGLSGDDVLGHTLRGCVD